MLLLPKILLLKRSLLKLSKYKEYMMIKIRDKTQENLFPLVVILAMIVGGFISFNELFRYLNHKILIIFQISI